MLGGYLMWSLVLIALQMNVAQAQIVGDFGTMNSCFEARELLLEKYREGNALSRLPADIQALCVRRKSL